MEYFRELHKFTNKDKNALGKNKSLPNLTRSKNPGNVNCDYLGR